MKARARLRARIAEREAIAERYVIVQAPPCEHGRISSNIVNLVSSAVARLGLQRKPPLLIMQLDVDFRRSTGLLCCSQDLLEKLQSAARQYCQVPAIVGYDPNGYVVLNIIATCTPGQRWEMKPESYIPIEPGPGGRAILPLCDDDSRENRELVKAAVERNISKAEQCIGAERDKCAHQRRELREEKEAAAAAAAAPASDYEKELEQQEQRKVAKQKKKKKAKNAGAAAPESPEQPPRSPRLFAVAPPGGPAILNDFKQAPSPRSK